ncbi:cytoplasmic protein [Radiomyces spectabilis]|uniref:cytoplasmic protein n=1 Tax=Radiomyces spectabilis TaxID=64574 RepID=UPI00221F2129|nr:cytoplasmic protein [Radiomyces spectabilis]KAI8379493.1 cytoplasmic protein [Radiomyces spectabilis]
MSQNSTTSEQYEDRLPDHQDSNLHEANDDGDDALTLRALVSTKEAGVVIGKGGKNVAELRYSTGVKAGVSKVVQGVHDRVLTVSGSLEDVAQAYSLIAQTLLDNPISPLSPPTSPTVANIPATNVATIRLLISHNLMGTVIGRQGAKIKHIQDTSGVRMIASKTLLPQSTERVVEMRGTTESIRLAILEIGHCLIEDKDRAYGTILYNPTKVAVTTDRRNSITRTGNGADFSNDYQPQRRSSATSQNFLNNPNIRTQNISIPSDMVGCIIGKGGSKISEIRRLSGSRISIAKVPHDESGERMFTIQGTAESNERALYLLYGQLEHEKERRLRGSMHEEDILEEEEHV